ncbi:AAA family ATPase [Candidatus Woesearchaeota archaeon]|nr:AAA family ATPase [Candidatus Woesearchaeota archaeon]
MGVFDKLLKDGESLFKNEIALDFSFIPKLIPYRENEQFRIAGAIRPLFNSRNGQNIIIVGKQGIGKTVACRHVLQELEEKTDEIVPIYVNCWQNNTSFKIILSICEQVEFKFTQNKRTDELFTIAAKILNKKAAVFVFDEIDKAEDFDFLYTLLEDIYRKTIILITNHPEFITTMDSRIRSRLVPEVIDFKPYAKEELKGILKQRIEYAFFDDVIEQDAFNMIVEKAFELKDVRQGLFMLKEAGRAAENRASRRIEVKDAENAVAKMGNTEVKEEANGEEETKRIMDAIKNNSGEKIGDIFKQYQGKGGLLNYKAFNRKIKKLADERYIKTELISGGSDGRTTIIKKGEKKLTEF